MEAVLAGCFLDELPERLIGDKAYDSDALDEQMNECGVEMIAPNRANRKQKTQDGRALRRYKRRWKVERLFTWMLSTVSDQMGSEDRKLPRFRATWMPAHPREAFMRWLLGIYNKWTESFRNAL